MRSQWEAEIEGESGGEECEDGEEGQEEESDKKMIHEGGSALKSP